MLAERDLVRQGLPLVHAMARRFARRLGSLVNLDDLLSIGHVALLDVARTYDPSRAAFPVYAAAKLRYAMLDGLRRETHGRSGSARLLAVLAAERYGGPEESDDDAPTTLEQDQAAFTALLEGKAAALVLGLLAGATGPEVHEPGHPTPEEQLTRAQLVHAARGAVRSLPDLQRAIVERHYFGGESFQDIARDLDISKGWASRLHDRAIERLKQDLRDPSSIDESVDLPP